jgi:transcriptional regulator with XRE-family HTH domain
MNFLETIGHNIRTIRKLKGYSQLKLATMCGLTRPAISMIENGQKNSHIMTLYKIAEILKVDVKELI